VSEGDERWLCLGGRQHGWVVTAWDAATEAMTAYEVFCPTCGQLVGRRETEADWHWVPLDGGD
jgi:hypothetical protein